MILSILLYLFVFAGSAIIVQCGYKYKSYTIQIIGISLPIILGGLRYNVGLDYFSYLNAYADVVNPQVIGYRYLATPELDYSFYVISHVSDFLFSSPIAMYLIYCTVTTFAFYRALQIMKPKNVGVPLFFFYSIFFLNSFNLVRQGAAISIGCLAITHYSNGNKLKAIIYLLIAVAFHSSAILLVIYIFAERLLKNRYITKNRDFKSMLVMTCIISTGIAIAGSLSVSISSFIYSATGRIGDFDSMFSMGVVFKYIICLACLWLAAYAWKDFNNSQKQLCLFVAIGAVVYSLGLVHNESARLGMYLITLTPILFASINDKFKPHQYKLKLFTSSSLILLGIAYIVAVHLESGNGVRYDYMDVMTSNEYRQQIKDLDI